MAEKVFAKIYNEAEVKDNVKIISYEQFKEIIDSGEGVFILDVRSSQAYAKGHIKDAISVPVDTINEQCVTEMLHSNSNTVVYCGGYSCFSSTQAANKLQALGMINVLDFKGGREEWEERGGQLVT